MKAAIFTVLLVLIVAPFAKAQTPQLHIRVDNIFPNGGSFVSEVICSLNSQEIFSICTENPKKLSLAAINTNGERMRKSTPSDGKWTVHIWSGENFPAKKIGIKALSFGQCDIDWKIDIFNPQGSRVQSRIFYGDDYFAFELPAVTVSFDQWTQGYTAQIYMASQSSVPEPASYIILLSGSILLLLTFGVKNKK